MKIEMTLIYTLTNRRFLKSLYEHDMGMLNKYWNKKYETCQIFKICLVQKLIRHLINIRIVFDQYLMSRQLLFLSVGTWSVFEYFSVSISSVFDQYLTCYCSVFHQYLISILPIFDQNLNNSDWVLDIFPPHFASETAKSEPWL